VAPHPHPTGMFFDTQTPEALLATLALFEAMPAGTFDAKACRANAERFGAERFRSELSQLVNEGHRRLQAELTTPVDEDVCAPMRESADDPSAPSVTESANVVDFRHDGYADLEPGFDNRGLRSDTELARAL
jgi:hypothetical protein